MTPWLITAVTIALMFYLLYRMHRRKAAEQRSHHVITPVQFPPVHVPLAVGLEDARNIAETLSATYREAWAAFDAIYQASGQQFPVSTVGCTMGECHSEHPHVYWSRGSSKIVLRIQSTMYYWFARELHNVYRYTLRGVDGIYNTFSSDDRANALAAEQWITNHIADGRGE